MLEGLLRSGHVVSVRACVETVLWATRYVGNPGHVSLCFQLCRCIRPQAVALILYSMTILACQVADELTKGVLMKLRVDRERERLVAESVKPSL